MIQRPADADRVAPLLRLTPVRPADAVASAPHDAAFRAAQWIKGREYLGRVLEPLAPGWFRVQVDGVDLRMRLDAGLQAGQQLRLTYLQDTPQPTFRLSVPVPLPAVPAGVSAELSAAARLLLAQRDAPAAASYRAAAPVSHAPGDATTLAGDLRQALASSGLFYESHLAEFSEGRRSLPELLREPQNTGEEAPEALLPKQLAVLEGQRLHWQGDVWPGQPMAWQVELREPPPETESAPEGSGADERAVVSELTLQLPRLGTVTVRLELQQGRARVHLAASDETTRAQLQADVARLAGSFAPPVPQLEAVTVGRLD